MPAQPYGLLEYTYTCIHMYTQYKATHSRAWLTAKNPKRTQHTVKQMHTGTVRTACTASSCAARNGLPVGSLTIGEQSNWKLTKNIDVQQHFSAVLLHSVLCISLLHDLINPHLWRVPFYCLQIQRQWSDYYFLKLCRYKAAFSLTELLMHSGQHTTQHDAMLQNRPGSTSAGKLFFLQQFHFNPLKPNYCCEIICSLF